MDIEEKQRTRFFPQYYLYIMGFNKTLKTMDKETFNELSSPMWDRGFVSGTIIGYLKKSKNLNQ